MRFCEAPRRKAHRESGPLPLWPEPQEVLRLLILHDRFLGDHRRFLLHPVLHLIDNDRHNNHDPFDDHLPELAHPHHHQPVGEKTDDKRTNQRTQNGSPAAIAFISKAVPLAGWLASSCAETTIPAMAAQKPDSV